MCLLCSLLFLSCRHIIPYLQQHHKNPITSAPLHLRDLIRLHFHTEPSTSASASSSASTPIQYICPVSHKPFSPLHTHIVAIATAGNVYSADVVEELCVKAGVLEDLVSGEKFKKEDIITLQDPHNLKTRSVRRVDDESAAEPKQKPAASQPTKLTSSSAATSTAATSSSSSSSSTSSTPFVARGLHSSHHATGSFTSTAITPVTANTRTALTDADKRLQQYKTIRAQKSTKAYARLHIQHYGHINLTLHASQTPHTVHNFLTLAQRGYYDGTASHRLLAGFMVQFGDPTGTGRGGSGAFERTFDDEIVAALKHDKKGVLSMANSGSKGGRGTNGSQFFITFAPCSHLDGKHTVFGQVVGSMAALDAIERAGDRGDKDDGKKQSSSGVQPVVIERVEVFENPFKDDWVAKDALTGQREDEAEQRAADDKKQQVDNERKQWFSSPVAVDRSAEQKEIGYLIKPSEGAGDSLGRKRKEGPMMPAPVNDEDEAIRLMKKRQAISRAMAAPRPGASFDFSGW